MDPSLDEKLITTKDAGEISGYTSDYLSRLVRSGKIAGKRIGHSWVIDRRSLECFLDAQGNRKIDRSRTLASERALEYRMHRSLLHRATRKLTTSPSIPQLGGGKRIGHRVSNTSAMSDRNIGKSSLRSRALALSVALLMVASGAAAARSPALSHLARAGADVARETAFGFRAAFGDFPARIAERIAAAETEMRALSSRARTTPARTTAPLTTPLLAGPDLSSLRFALAPLPTKFVTGLGEDRQVRVTPQLGSRTSKLRARPVGNLISNGASAPVLTIEDLKSSVRALYENLASPSRVADALANTYLNIGEHAYAAIASSFAAYDALIEASGTRALALAASVRDTYRLALAPLPIKFVTGLGEAVVRASHAAIRAEVHLAYGLSSAAPASAQAIVALLGDTGDALARITSRTPALAVSFFLNTAALPSELAPALAQAVFNAEYQGAERFLALRSLGEVGPVLRSLGEAGIALSHSALDTLAAAPAALSDASLGALGTLARIAAYDVPALVRAIAHAPQVAAALSPAERVALATYETIHDLFDSATRALAFLFAPLPTIVLPSPPSAVPEPPAVAVVATSTPTERGPFFPSYPTYTTVVQGVSANFMNQSLAALRTDILSVVSGLVRPVQTQVVQNSTTIQQVNRIEELHDLVVKNGDFRNSIFDSGIRVSATGGSFTNLTGGTTTLANTTVSGTLSATGALSSDTSATAPFFTATSTTATSTFAGRLAIGTTTPYGNGLLTVGTSSPLLYISSTTGRIGVGTTSPLASLGIQGSLGVNASHLYLADNGRIGIGTTSPDALLSLLQNANGTPFISAYRATDTAPAGDFINFRTNAGTTLFRVDNSGNLLAGGIINTGSQTITSVSQPQFRVQYDPNNEITTSVGSTGTTTISINGSAPSLSFTPGSNSVNTFNFTNAASNSVLSIDTSNRRVGIGTTSPFAKFSIHANNGETNQTLFSIASSTASATTTHFVVTNGGNVGIGTTMATAVLNVAKADSSGLTDLLVNPTTKTSGNLLDLKIGGSSLFSVNSGGAVFGSGSIQITYGSVFRDSLVGNFFLPSDGFGSTMIGNNAGGGNGNIQFQTLGASLLTRMVITAGGQVGIGSELSPTNALTVNGALSVGNSSYNVTAPTNGAIIQGNVGIGTTTPWAKLSIHANNGETNQTLFSIASSTASATTTHFVVTNGGNVGIGTVEPNQKLTVEGNAAVRSGNLLLAYSPDNSKYLQINNNGSYADINAKSGLPLNLASSESYIFFSPSNIEKVRLTAAGNLGIGTTTPWAQLSVNPNGVTGPAFAIGSSTKTDFVVTNAGNVGVGTASPASLLHLESSSGVARITTDALVGQANGLMLRAGYTERFLLGVAAGTDDGITGTTQNDSFIRSSGDMLFSANGGTTGHLTILNSGNVGIGTVSPDGKLHVLSGSAGTITANAVSDDLTIEGSGNTGLSILYPSGSAGAINFGIADVNTVAATVDFDGTQMVVGTNVAAGYVDINTGAGTGAIRINSSQNVKIGNIGEAPINKLDIEGAVAIGATYAGTNTAPTNGLLVEGNVGIGTTSPGQKFDVFGGDANGYIANFDRSTSEKWLKLWSGNSAYSGLVAEGHMQFFTNAQVATPSVTILDTGNVGIGNTNPPVKLSVGAVNDVSAIAIAAFRPANGSGISIDAGSTSDTNYLFFGDAAGTGRDSGFIQYAHATDAMTLGTNAVGKVTILSTGNVGIGTTTPATLLNVAGTGGFQFIVTATDAGVDGKHRYIGNTGGNLVFGKRNDALTTNTEFMRIDGNGNVGIGTANPDTLLQVSNSDSSGAIHVGDDAAPANAYQYINFGGDTGGERGWQIGKANQSGSIAPSEGFYIYDIAGSATRMVIATSTGNVGIGVTNPTGAKLHIAGTSVSGASSQTNISAYTGNGVRIDGSIANASQDAITYQSGAGGGAAISLGRGTSYDTFMAFYTNAASNAVAGGMTERMRIIESGNVGIGTTSPVSVLAVNAGSTASNGIWLSGASSPRIRIEATPAASFLDLQTDANTGFVGTGNNVPLVFRTNVTERVRIDTSGNVGIGTTSPVGLLHINRGLSGISTFDTDGDELIVASNARAGMTLATPDTFGGYIVWASPSDNFAASISSDYTSKLFKVGPETTGGELKLTYGAGSTGVYINSSGLVGIGTTTPGAALDVLGKLQFSNPTGNTGLISNGGATGDVRIFGGSSGTNGAGVILFGGSHGATPNQFSFMQGSSEVVTILNGGNVGIGATNPLNLLELGVHTTAADRAIAIKTGVSQTSKIGFWEQNEDTGFAVGYDGVTNKGFFSIHNGSATRNDVITVDVTNGNVGIGTTTPDSTLTVTGSARIQRLGALVPLNFQRYGTAAANDVIGQINFQGNDSAGNRTDYAFIDAISTTITDSSEAGALTFNTVNSGSTGERMRITSSGNVGIGTTSPDAKLQVVGNIKLTGASQSISAAPLTGFVTNLDLIAAEAGGSYGGNGAAIRLQSADAVANGYIMFSTNQGGVGASERMRITNTGNVGIGTTGPGARLEVKSATAKAGSRVDHSIFSSSDTSNALSLFVVQGSNPTAASSWMGLQSVESGVAYRALVLQPDAGNVGIGTTTPTSLLYLTGAQPALSLDNTTGTSKRTAINFLSTSTAQFQLGTDANANSSRDFYLFDSIAGAFRLVVNSSGNVGIGTTTPTWGDSNVLTIAGSPRPVLRLARTGGSEYIIGVEDANDKLYVVNSAGVTLPRDSTKGIIIDTSGNVGIGTSNPGGLLHLKGSAATSATPRFEIETQYSAGDGSTTPGGRIAFTQTTAPTTRVDIAYIDTAEFETNSFGLSFSTGLTTPTSKMVIMGNGNVGIGTTSPATKLHVDIGASDGNVAEFEDVSGSCYVTPISTALSCPSDIRKKKDVVALENALQTVLSLRAVRYHWNFEESSNPTRIGFIAQEVETLYPELVQTDNSAEGYKTLNYAGFTPILAQGIQDIARRIDLVDAPTTTPSISINRFGNVGIGTDTPAHTLDVAGDVGAISFVNTSTKSLKTDVSYLSASSTADMLNRLVRLQAATYRYTIEKESDPLRIGFIAEDAATIAPEILSPDGKGVDLYKLATFTLSGVQALAAKVDAAETRLATLEERLLALESGAISTASGSPLALSSSTLASALEGLGVLIQKGIAQFNTLVFRQLVASRDADGTSSAGSVSILTGNTVAQVNNSLVLPSTKVFVTFNSRLAGSWWVSDKLAGSFRVVLSEPQAADVSFDYFLVQTEGALATSTPLSTYGSQTALTSGTDITAPVITLLGDNPMRLSIGGTFIEPGVTITDNVDPSTAFQAGGPLAYKTYVNGIEEPDVASVIDTSSETTYIITYSATDQQGNFSTVTRAVIVGSTSFDTAQDESLTTGGTTSTTTPSSSGDTVAPVVTLIGGAAMELIVGETFTDPGATAADDTDGDLTAAIVVTGAVDTATEGSYTLTYTATDAAGNSAGVSRLVSVVASTSTTASSTPST